MAPNFHFWLYSPKKVRKTEANIYGQKICTQVDITTLSIGSSPLNYCIVYYYDQIFTIIILSQVI